METNSTDTAPTPEHSAQSGEHRDQQAQAKKPKRFATNYSRPTYLGVVQISYFWAPLAAHTRHRQKSGYIKYSLIQALSRALVTCVKCDASVCSRPRSMAASSASYDSVTLQATRLQTNKR